MLVIRAALRTGYMASRSNSGFVNVYLMMLSTSLRVKSHVGLVIDSIRGLSSLVGHASWDQASLTGFWRLGFGCVSGELVGELLRFLVTVNSFVASSCCGGWTFKELVGELLRFLVMENMFIVSSCCD